MHNVTLLTAEDIKVTQYGENLEIWPGKPGLILAPCAATKLAVELNINGFGAQYLKQHLIEAQMKFNSIRWDPRLPSRALHIATAQITELLSYIK